MRPYKKITLLILFFLVGLGPWVPESFSAENKKRKLPSVPEKPIVIKPVTLPIPPHIPDPSIAEIQKQLQEILKVHQSLELQRDRELEEIQKIMEQSRIHQQLLKDLAKPAQVKQQPVLEEALRREKIQIIEKEALKNQSKIEELKKKSSPKKK